MRILSALAAMLTCLACVQPQALDAANGAGYARQLPVAQHQCCSTLPRVGLAEQVPIIVARVSRAFKRETL